MADTLLAVKDLKMHFPIRKGFSVKPLKAVDGVTFDISRGETLGLVGESGCGKSTVGRTILRFYKPTGGQILFDGQDITHADMAPYRKRMQIVFQDPYSSLDPRLTVGEIVSEPLEIQFPQMSKAERRERVVEQLDLVGLNSEHMNRFPHEFSGGQRQRISIARALAVKPEFMVCDEPISALDVSIQAQVINMLMELQQKLGMAYLFIAHDLSVVRHISKRVAVMYLGHIMENNDAVDLYKHPLHPYTQALLTAIPVVDPEINRARKAQMLEGDVPSPMNPPPGCAFSTRCPYAREACSQTAPQLLDVGGRHLVACHKVAQGW